MHGITVRGFYAKSTQLNAHVKNPAAHRVPAGLIAHRAYYFDIDLS
jgi:hypothetical protein